MNQYIITWDGFKLLDAYFLEHSDPIVQMMWINLKNKEFSLYNPQFDQYQCGDECKGECSGEVDGIPHCPVSDSIISVDADCNVTYADGRTEPCKYQPRFTFAECEPGYGSHDDCPKWDYYNQQNKVGRDTTNDDENVDYRGYI